MTRKSTSFQRTVDAAYDIEGSRVRCEIARNQGATERLDAFLALAPEARAAAWRLMDDAQRRELVTFQGVRQGKDVSDSWIDGSVAGLNAKWGATPTTTEAAIVAALEDAEARMSVASIHAYGAGDDDSGKFFSRERNAAHRALEQYRAGIRPELTDDDTWRVRSASSSAVYTVSRGGSCNCKAGEHNQPCWHCAIVASTETGLDNLNAYDSGDWEADAPALTDEDHARALDEYDMAA